MNKQVAFIDVETTGMSSDYSEVIELGVMLGEFDGRQLVRVVEEYCEFQDPFYQIPYAITNITGIDNEMVQGKSLDMNKILSILNRADAIIAHNASFDRGFVGKLFPEAIDMNWYCSVRQIKWKHFGFENGKLQQLLRAHHIDVKQAHRALDDANNLAALLNCSNPYLDMEATFLSYLLKKDPLKKPVKLSR